MIIDRLIDRVGDSNPQLFRELKERLTSRNLGLTVTISMLLQGFVWVYLNGKIPTPNPNPLFSDVRDRLCLSIPPDNNGYHKCHLISNGGFDLNWQLWWADMFTALSWILPLGLILGSVYLLVADLVQEEKRGTLNFIRLSPQSAPTIAIGKIFGVPILVYLAALLMVPFHLWAGIQGGGNLILIGSLYLVVGSIWYLLSSASVLYVLLGGAQAILTVAAIAYPLSRLLLIINNYASATLDPHSWLRRIEDLPKIAWFFLPIASRAAWVNVFITASCFLATYWVWQALERRYLNPTATVISKPQSYLLNLCIQIWIAGFIIPGRFGVRYVNLNEEVISGIATMDFIALLCFIPLLLPTKQALQDWSRYRRERVTHAPRKFWQRELVRDLISHEKSPALLAMAINLGMALVLWLPVSLISFTNRSHGIRFIGGLCIATVLVLMYTAIAHLCLFLNVKKRTLWVVAVTAGAIFLPGVIAFVICHGGTPSGIAAILLLFSPLAPAGIIRLSGMSILITFVAQLSLLTGLTRQFQRKMQIAGQSQTKELVINREVDNYKDK